jgi:hypothetical protein
MRDQLFRTWTVTVVIVAAIAVLPALAERGAGQETRIVLYSDKPPAEGAKPVGKSSMTYGADVEVKLGADGVTDISGSGAAELVVGLKGNCGDVRRLSQASVEVAEESFRLEVNQEHKTYSSDYKRKTFPLNLRKLLGDDRIGEACRLAAKRAADKKSTSVDALLRDDWKGEATISQNVLFRMGCRDVKKIGFSEPLTFKAEAEAKFRVDCSAYSSRIKRTAKTRPAKTTPKAKTAPKPARQKAAASKPARASGVGRKADLTITAAEIGGDGKSVFITVRYDGEAASGKTRARIQYIFEGADPTNGSVTIPVLEPGEEVIVKYQGGIPVSAASSVSVRADDPSVVDEIDEGNNSIEVKPAIQ